VKDIINGFNAHSYSILYWLVAFIAFFIVIMGRYLFIAGIFYTIFYIWFPKKWRDRKLCARSYKPGQLQNEIRWSIISAAIFSVFGIISLWLWIAGYTKIYSNVLQYRIWWLPVSLSLSMFLQETYYYWLHRLMHLPLFYSVVHKVHHDSYTTSPFTAFSFHPIESFLQAIALPLVLLVIPLHPVTLVLLLTIMTFTSVINHLNIEIYPRGYAAHPVGKWLIGPTHHAKHHTRYQYNFGLYFTFWDKLLKTESPDHDHSSVSVATEIKEVIRV
jgi:sterol desaturase/sphingolipid hydroxylase (fatty acid hydroxylase superfamily)